MDKFKLKPGIGFEYHINEHNFLRATGKKYPYRRTNPQTGKEKLFAVCPFCDNPIEIIGLYRNTIEGGSKVYGRHYGQSVPDLAEYNHDAYLNCIYAKPSWSNSGGRRAGEDIRALRVKDFLKEQFDRVIYIIAQDTDMIISPNIAQDMLCCYIDNEAWKYRNSRENNLPWVMAEADRNRTMFGRLIKADSELCQAIVERCPEVRLVRQNERDKYVQVQSANGNFVSLSYHFMEHRFIPDSDGERVDEQIHFRVIRGESPNLEEIYSKNIPIDVNRFVKLCQTPPEKSRRNQKLLDIAAALLGE